MSMKRWKVPWADRAEFTRGRNQPRPKSTGRKHRRPKSMYTREDTWPTGASRGGTLPISMELQPLLLISLLGFLHKAVSGRHGNCTWDHQGETTCVHDVNDIVQLHVYAIVNPCNHPLDVTFNLQATNMSWTWEYTFVNPDETQPLQGLPWDIALRVVLQEKPGGSTFVHAQFFEDGLPLQRFMDQTIPPRSCRHHNNFNQYLPLVVFVVLLVLIVTMVIGMIAYRRQQHRKTTNRLLYHMEISPQQPYQEEPIAGQYFDNGGNMTSTVIKNSLYGDSVSAEGEPTANGTALPPGAVGGVPETGTAAKNNSKKKAKKKKKKKEKLKCLLPSYQEKDKDEVVLRVDFLR